MDKTIVAILCVLVAALGIYMMFPEGLPGTGMDTVVGDMPREGNGLVGRFVDTLADMSWHPAHMIMVVSVLLVGSFGLVIYWNSIQD